MRHNQEATCNRFPDTNEPIFIVSMRGILDGERKRVAKNRNRFVECDAVLPLIEARFGLVPFKRCAHVRAPHIALSISWRLSQSRVRHTRETKHGAAAVSPLETAAALWGR